MKKKEIINAFYYNVDYEMIFIDGSKIPDIIDNIDVLELEMKNLAFSVE